MRVEACLRALALALLVAVAAGGAPAPAPPQQPDIRSLDDRITMRYVRVVDDSGFEADDDGNMFERVVLFVICIWTTLFVLGTLCYSCFTGGKGNYLRPQTPYRPQQFIEADRATNTLASGGA
eukprot:TRINITY_DN12248_c0_g1_i2.p1 TRINITY_DN12248_c0_g1~~TRINITY_DN12248_c0_g1_i2.p1  ORF type:complete len:143 (+),score=20.48 TRINITY_DN12248_c0_g1_i2:63-431(+)